MDLIRLFYIMLMFENEYKKNNNPGDPMIQGHKRDTAVLSFCFSFFFFNQRQLDASDIESFIKVTFYPENYTTNNYKL